jgi:hypothetical protein
MLSTFAVESQTKFDRDIPNSPKTKDVFLIARSNELDNLLYNYTLKTGNNQVRDYRRTLADYSTAYLTAQIHFNLITEQGTERIIGYGFPTRALKGGGTSNLRPYGNYSPSPTIDIYNHYTYTLGGQEFSKVREIKFNFQPSRSCPVSTFSVC